MRSGYKIAIVSDWYLPRIGGLELHLRDLARELNRRGHEAHVITATPGNGDESGSDGITVHRLDVPLMPGLDTIRSKKALRPLEALFVREGYDIIHAHTALSPLAIGATRVAKRLRIPSVMTEHSVLSGAGAALLSALHRVWGWANWADVLSAVSHYVAKEMRDLSGRKDVYVLPNGVNPREWKTTHPSPRAGEPLRVTTVMRFTKRKKPHAIIQAIPKINALLPEHIRPTFTLVGDGPERAHVEREIARLGVASQVELTGFRPRHEIREILARSSLFILPTSKEALSIATLEARCCGLPVVAMNHGGVGDLIKNGREGYLANSRAEFIARIAEVMADESLRARMSAATKRSLDWFTWDSVIAQHMHVYRLAYQACHGVAPSFRIWPENEALRERLA